MQGSATPKTLLSWEGLEVGCWQLMSLDFGSCGTTIHLCHLVLFDSQNQNKQLFVFKRMAYLVDQIDSVGVSHKTISIATKTFEQINAEYLALQILQSCKRVVRFYTIVNENPSEEEDAEFFYGFLKQKKIKGVRNVCLVLENCQGGNLQQFIANHVGIILWQTIVNFALEITQGIQEMQSKGILHRDLRTSNIFIKDNHVKIGDFDSAFIQNFSSVQHVKTGINSNTASPELVDLLDISFDELEELHSSGKLFAKQQHCDMFSLGAILYEMIFKTEYRHDKNKECSSYTFSQGSQEYTEKMSLLLNGLLASEPPDRMSIEQVIQILNPLCEGTQVVIDKLPKKLPDISSFKTINESQADTMDSEANQKSASISLSFGPAQYSQDPFIESSNIKTSKEIKAASYNEVASQVKAFKKKHNTNNTRIILKHDKENSQEITSPAKDVENSNSESFREIGKKCRS